MAVPEWQHEYETLALSAPRPGVVHVELNRPRKANAMSRAFFRECREAFTALGRDRAVRAIVVSGRGAKGFSAGLDLVDHASNGGLTSESNEDGEGSESDTARIGLRLREHIFSYQEAFSTIERCPQPVIAAVHGVAVGGAIDLATACDIRWCSDDVFFSVKEVDVGLAADVGTLQRLPKVVGNASLVAELAYTGRRLHAAEAHAAGLVSRVVPNGAAGAGAEAGQAVKQAALELAADIAGKSPIAVVGTKRNLLYSRDHTVADGLDYVRTWNMAALQTADVATAAAAFFAKSTPTFSKL